jgi:hypothetical protein
VRLRQPCPFRGRVPPRSRMRTLGVPPHVRTCPMQDPCLSGGLFGDVERPPETQRILHLALCSARRAKALTRGQTRASGNSSACASAIPAGPISEKILVDMRSSAVEPMSFGRLYPRPPGTPAHLRGRRRLRRADVRSGLILGLRRGFPGLHSTCREAARGRPVHEDAPLGLILTCCGCIPG